MVIDVFQSRFSVSEAILFKFFCHRSQFFSATGASFIAGLNLASAVGTHELLLHQVKPLLFLRDSSILEKEHSFGV